MHAGFRTVAFSTLDHGVAFLGGLKRSGDAPKGIPRNLLMLVVEPKTDDVVPTSTPVSIVTVGVVGAE